MLYQGGKICIKNAVINMNIFYSNSICQSNNNVNEDISTINEYGAWILDGATGLSGKNLIDNCSDARWYVNQWNDYLKKNIHKLDMDLKRIMKKGINIIKDKYYKEVRDKNITSLDLPSSSIVVVRWFKNTLEYFILGDCTLIIEKNNNVKIIKDDSVTKLDNKIFKTMDKIMKEENKSLREAKSKVKDLIISNRLLKNRKDGYWILEFNTEALDNALYEKISLNGDIKLLMTSDGFSAIADRYNYISMEDLIYEAKNRGLDSLCKELRAVEERDYKGIKYPRFKKSDDASAIYVELIKEAMVNYV